MAAESVSFRHFQKQPLILAVAVLSVFQIISLGMMRAEKISLSGGKSLAQARRISEVPEAIVTEWRVETGAVISGEK